MQLLETMKNNCEFYQLVKGYPGGIVIFGLKGEILEVNETFERLLGCSNEQICFEKYQGITAEDCRTKEAKILEKQALARGYTDQYEKEYDFGVGSPTFVTQHVYLIRNYENRPQYMLAMISPIANEKTTNSDMNDLQGEGALEQELETLKRQHANLRAEFEHTKSELMASKDKKAIEEMAAELEKTKEDITQSHEKVTTLEKEVGRITKLLNWKEKLHLELEEEHNSLKDELVAVRGELEVVLIMQEQEEKVEQQKELEDSIAWDTLEKDDDTENAKASLESADVDSNEENTEEDENSDISLDSK